MTFDELDLLGADNLSTVEGAIAAGNRDVNALTDLEFFRRHPERGGAKIEAGDTASAKEWEQIRDAVVRPALAKAMSAAAVQVGPPAAAVQAGPPAAEDAAAQTKRNRIIAGVLGGLALVGIGVAVTR